MARSDVPSVDETFELLSHNWGRLVLQYFDQHPNPVKLEEMAPTVARWDAPDSTVPTEEEIDHVAERLHDEYLPWLADMGLAVYDSDGRMLRYDAGTITTAIENVDAVVQFVWTPEDHSADDFGGDAGES